MKPRILISNDDGIEAVGVRALERALETLGELWVVAPETEQSAASHALSLHRPLRVRQLGPRRHAIDGTPADCVYIAIHHLMRGQRPALVVSGINHGPNLAEDVIYSGTVAAAMEGAILGIPSIAFSLATWTDFEFAHAAQFAASLVKCALASELPNKMLLNVNVPAPGAPRGYAITSLGKHSYTGEVIEKTDPRGRKYYWIGGSGYEYESTAGTDCSAVRDLQQVSVTPLKLDFSSSSDIQMLRGWELENFARSE